MKCLQSLNTIFMTKDKTLKMVEYLLWDALDKNNFLFLFLLFSDFIGILFSFSFSFLLDNEEARDTEVT